MISPQVIKYFFEKSFYRFNVCSDSSTIYHPVHIIKENNQISPSALIPFCDFGGDMEVVGEMIDLFKKIPVCKIFREKIMNDQLCYEVDLNIFSDKNNIENELKLGFNFLMDYNEDRQVTFYQHFSNRKLGLAKSIASSDQNQYAFVYLNTIGKNQKK